MKKKLPDAVKDDIIKYGVNQGMPSEIVQKKVSVNLPRLVPLHLILELITEEKLKLT